MKRYKNTESYKFRNINISGVAAVARFETVFR